jgi:hypothetical protein
MIDNTIQTMSTEELLTYINGGEASTPKASKKSRRRKRQKQEEAQKEAEAIEEEVDKKVEEFRAKLENICCLPERIKPNISQEWINGLRSRIQDVN